MKYTHVAWLAAFTALFTLSACGQRNDAGGSAAAVATEMAPTADAAEMAPGAVSSDTAWLPAEIDLPQPHTMVQNTRIGMRTNYLQILVQTDPTPELDRWKSALLAAGYEVEDDLVNGNLLFEGEGVESGKISVLQPEDQQGFMIQVDATRIQ